MNRKAAFDPERRTHRLEREQPPGRALFARPLRNFL